MTTQGETHRAKYGKRHVSKKHIREFRAMVAFLREKGLTQGTIGELAGYGPGGSGLSNAIRRGWAISQLRYDALRLHVEAHYGPLAEALKDTRTPRTNGRPVKRAQSAVSPLDEVDAAIAETEKKLGELKAAKAVLVSLGW